MASSDRQLPERSKKVDKKAAKGGASNQPVELDPPPAYFKHRIDLFESLKKKQDEHIAAQPRVPINIEMPDGKVKEGQSWETTPGSIAREISKSLYERTVISKVNGDLWDLDRPLEGNCKLEFLDFDTDEGKKVFWHSSAHILGEAAERKYGCDLCIGPPVDDGFYYEMALPGGAAIQHEDWPSLQTIVDKTVKEKQPFERLTLTKDELLEMFKSNKYKQHIIKDKIADGTSTTVYRCGPLIDLCRGPHVPHTGRIKTFQIMKNSASYFLGDANNDSLQRIYGVSFPDKDRMREHLRYLEEAAKRDHRKIGKEQELFFFHEQSPGSCFFLPHGTIIYNALQKFVREEYWKRGYQEVITPNMYNSELWKRSGHWQHYQDDMFTFEIEKDKWALKPMNCPGHCLLFGHRTRSYNELPMRIADFGILHRNEASGALTGLTRVRRFQQDDAHHFCMEDQVGDEILGIFDFLKTVYGNFGFSFKMKLSTRPDNFLGEIATWDRAEEKLRNALDQFTAEGGVQWELNPGDGAFYGPKIDITIQDALRREFQCATVQLDFQLPQQFNLEYVAPSQGNLAGEAKPDAAKDAKPDGEAKPQSAVASAVDAAASALSSVASAAEKAVANPAEAAAVATGASDPTKPGNAAPVNPAKYRTELTPGTARPVMIHRAICGSFERFIAILTEHFAGKWPLWLSPRQVLVVPVMPAANDYVHECVAALRSKGFNADPAVGGDTMQKKIRTGQLQQYNAIWVVGAEEKAGRSVNQRDRDDQATQQRGQIVPLEEAILRLEERRASKAFVLPTL